MIQIKKILTTKEFNKAPDITARLNDIIEFVFIFRNRAGSDVVVSQADLRVSKKDFDTLVEKDESDGITFDGNQASVQLDTSVLNETGKYIVQLFEGNYVITEYELTLKNTIGA